MLRDGKKCSENVFIILPLFRSLAHLPHSTIIQCVVCLRNFILIFVILCKYFFYFIVVVFVCCCCSFFSRIVALLFFSNLFVVRALYFLFIHQLYFIFESFFSFTRLFISVCSCYTLFKFYVVEEVVSSTLRYRPTKRERERERESLLELRTCTWEMRVDWFRRILKSTHSRMQRTNKNIFRKCIFGIVSRRMTELNKLIQLTK